MLTTITVQCACGALYEQNVILNPIEDSYLVTCPQCGLARSFMFDDIEVEEPVNVGIPTHEETTGDEPF